MLPHHHYYNSISQLFCHLVPHLTTTLTAHILPNQPLPDENREISENRMVLIGPEYWAVGTHQESGGYSGLQFETFQSECAAGSQAGKVIVRIYCNNIL